MKENRSLLFLILLSTFTLGIYSLFFWCFNRVYSYQAKELQW